MQVNVSLDVLHNQPYFGYCTTCNHAFTSGSTRRSRFAGGKLLTSHVQVLTTAIRAARAYLKVRAQVQQRHPERTGERLLLTSVGFPLSSEGGTDTIKRLGAAAGVAGAIPHRFRHTMATRYLSVHVGDESGLRGILGHLSKDVLAEYVHLSQAELRQRAGTVSMSRWLKEG